MRRVDCFASARARDLKRPAGMDPRKIEMSQRGPDDRNGDAHAAIPGEQRTIEPVAHLLNQFVAALPVRPAVEANGDRMMTRLARPNLRGEFQAATTFSTSRTW